MAKPQVKKLIEVKVIQGPVKFNGETFGDGEIFEADAKAIAPLVQAAVVVESGSLQEPLSKESGDTQDPGGSPKSPTELEEEKRTLPQSLINEKDQTLEKLKQ